MELKHRTLFQLAVLIVIISASCGSGQTPEPPTSTATIPPTMTFTPSPTYTPTPTFTPTATPTPRIPVLPGTQMPASDVVISADNIDQVVELARWGKGVITDATYSHDSKLIAVATTIGVSLYQADTLDEILYFETDASVNSLAFAPDGQTLATGLSDNTVKLWRESDGSFINSLDDHIEENSKNDVEKPEVTSIAFSPDGSLLAGGSTDGTVRIWRVSSGELINTYKSHTEKVTSVFFSLDGQAIFSASWDSKVQLVQVSDGKQIRKFSGTGSGSLIDAALSQDGKTLAAYDSQYGNIYLWNVEDGTKIKTFYARLEPRFTEISGIALSPDGKFIAAAYEDHTAKLWSMPEGVAQNTFEDLRPQDGWYYLSNFTIAFSPDSQLLLMAGTNGVGIWDVNNAELKNRAKIKTEEYLGISKSSDGNLLAAIEGPDVGLVQISDGSVSVTQDQIQSNGSLAFSPDGTSLLVSMFDSTARLWPLTDQGNKKIFETEENEYIRAAALSPDGQTIALEERNTGVVELRQITDGSLIWSMKIGSSYGIGSLVFSPEGKYLAAALNGQTRLFDVQDGKTIGLFNKGGLGISFSPDGELFAGGDFDKNLRIWKIPSSEEVYTLKNHPDIVTSTSFSPDGKILVVGTADGTIEVFLVSDGSLLRSWNEHSRRVSGLTFSSDGKLLISSSWDGTIRVWGIKP